MIVSLYGCSGGRSEPQSKNGLITTLVIVWPRESSSGRSPDAESSCSAAAMSYEKSCGPCLKSPSNALPYGSSSSLLGSHRCPAAGSHGPSTRKPYRCPGVIAGRYACQTKPSTSSRWMRSSVPDVSIRHSSTRSATSENTEKLVPAPSYVAPSGYGVAGPTLSRGGPGAGGGFGDGRTDLTSQLVDHRPHIGSRQVMRVVIHQHISLDRAANVVAAHRVAHVDRFEHRELRDKVQRRVRVVERIGAFHATRRGGAPPRKAVGRLERPDVAHHPGCVADP